MKFIILIFLFFPVLVLAEYDVEYFDKALNGKQKIEFLLGYQNQSITKSLVSTPSAKNDITESSSLFNFTYGYGISESMAVHAALGYLSSKITERNSPSSTNDADTKIAGLTDFNIYFIGNHDSKRGLFHWRLNLDYGLGDNKKEQVSSGLPSEYKSNHCCPV
ncbi:MAG: hypothetical protein H6625_11340 [Bdellovibrionaceae bacterium]|nr:hypothetical protein [Pseudobdellovibrionaceae bacterium]